MIGHITRLYLNIHIHRHTVFAKHTCIGTQFQRNWRYCLITYTHMYLYVAMERVKSSTLIFVSNHYWEAHQGKYHLNNLKPKVATLSGYLRERWRKATQRRKNRELIFWEYKCKEMSPTLNRHLRERERERERGPHNIMVSV